MSRYPFKHNSLTLLVAAAMTIVTFGCAEKKAAAPKPPERVPCTQKEAYDYAAKLVEVARQERIRAWQDDSHGSRQAAWLMAKAQYALTKAGFKYDGCEKKGNVLDKQKCYILEDYAKMLERACHQSRCGVVNIQEEPGSKLRAYISDIDQSFQTYSIYIPAMYDPSMKWPLIVSMHGHGWYAPFQGHPAPAYAGVFCLSPQGRGATDYKDVGEVDVMNAIEEVKKDFNIDPDRIYLTGGSMGGTGAFHLGTRYADNFAGIFPIVGNADNEAWTKAWGWNRKFEGRYDALRKWLQDGHTARAFAENLLNLPTFIMAGAADTVVPPDHSRNMVAILRKYGANVQYREFPGGGHGGFPKDAVADALAWTCSWPRNPFPRNIFWKADQIKYGKAYWIRMEQFERPLKTGGISAKIGRDGKLVVRTSNLLAFSFQRPPEIFPKDTSIIINVNGKELTLDKLPEEPHAWISVRNDPNHGWSDERLVSVEGLIKKAGVEGPINDVLNAPFMLVVGTSSPDPEMNAAWMQEAKTFMSEWKRRNGAPCLMVTDTKCSIEDMQKRNIILFGGSRDNCISDILSSSLPTSDVMANLPLRNEDPETVGMDALNAPDLGYMMLYPNVEYAPDRLVVVVSANSPESAYQLWGRFGNWFNWGVFDCKKYFDYAVFDSRSVSPETMLLLGWFGTDWKVESGSFFIGDENLRANVAPQGFPPFKSVPEDISTLSLAEVMPSKIDQMRGALGYSRGFFGEKLDAPVSLGMRAPCTLEYEINGLFTNFTAKAQLLNSPETDMCMIREKGEKIRFAVYGDGVKLAEKTVDWKKTNDELKVNVTNVKLLRLEAVPSGGPSWLHSGCAWLEPTLTK